MQYIKSFFNILLDFYIRHRDLVVGIIIGFGSNLVAGFITGNYISPLVLLLGLLIIAMGGLIVFWDYLVYVLYALYFLYPNTKFR